MIVFVILGLVCSVNCFNYEPRLPVIKFGPADSFFGYSVAEHIIQHDRENTPYLLVGAPRAFNFQNRSGLVFRCPMSSKFYDCTPIEIELPNEVPAPNSDREDQWLGVVVKSGGIGSKVVACAHRYTLKGKGYRWGQGICYSLYQHLDFHRVWEPCYNRPVKRAHEEFGFCQAGTSADISSKHDLIIGTPGPYTWRGTVFSNSIDFNIKDDKTWRHGPLVETNSPVDKYSYLGMSVTSGKFFNDNLSFVSGAPRSNGTGQVVFFSKQKGSDFKVDQILSGDRFGSQFGYTLLAMDFNKDGKSDLVVGAPFFYNGTQGIGGAVYIYNNHGNKIRPKPDLILTGTPSERSEARFGFALADCGDINKDGFNDLAIGAPYDDGGGAVYIYLGSKNGLKPKPVQIIRGSDIEWANRFSPTGPLKTFGYSLSGSMDLDNNGYPDLLVGCYESDVTVLLRTKPIVDITSQIKGRLKQIDPNRAGCTDYPASPTPCFSFDVCLQIKSKDAKLSPTYLNYTIEAETFGEKKPLLPRVRFQSASDTDTPHITSRRVTLRSRNVECFKEVVHLKEKMDYYKSVKFQLRIAMDELPYPDHADSDLLPRIDIYQILNQEEAVKNFDASFIRSCSNGDICKSNLIVTHAAVSSKDISRRQEGPISLGQEEFNLEITVQNTAEPAYDAYLYVYHPDIIYSSKKQIKGEIIDCKFLNMSFLQCFLGNPFKRGESKFVLSFDADEFPENSPAIKLKIFTNTTSIDSNQGKIIEPSYPVVRYAELEVRGASFPTSVWYGGDVVGESAMKTADDVGNQVQHAYTITTSGPYSPKELIVDVEWPYSVASRTGEEGKWLLYLMKAMVIGSGQCHVEKGEINPLGLQDTGSDISFPAASLAKLRAKRQASIASKRVVEDGKSQNIVTFDCRLNTARCYKIRCYIHNNIPGQSSIIILSGRLWNSTFVEDYADDVNQVHIISRARLSTTIKQNRTADDVHFAITKAYPDLPSLPGSRVPLWILIMSILLGVLLLVLLVILLWRCGFFIRQKPGYMAAPIDDKDYGY